ncbi:MAG TPA: helix-turn-helix domain-containing protein [Candidatus Saccharimonadales bacterium]|nr:helix-turn-helix domain-containing protein [Candidatus Saccharimonadales bacterium]
MDRALANALLQLGCSEKHIRFYRANLELGAATLMEIAKKARLQRSTAYLIATELIEKGLIIGDHKAYKESFSAAEPDVILQKLEAKQRQVGRSSLAFKEALPELRAAHQTTLTRPRVRTFEGKAGLLGVWKNIMTTTDEILLWTNQESERQVFGDGTHDLFIRERLSKRIPIRVLAVNNSEAERLVAADAACLRQTKLLPPDTSFTSETYIYGNKVAVLDIGKSIFGVITENEQIAASQRALFELVWSARP